MGRKNETREAQNRKIKKNSRRAKRQAAHRTDHVQGGAQHNVPLQQKAPRQESLVLSLSQAEPVGTGGFAARFRTVARKAVRGLGKRFPAIVGVVTSLAITATSVFAGTIEKSKSTQRIAEADTMAQTVAAPETLHPLPAIVDGAQQTRPAQKAQHAAKPVQQKEKLSFYASKLKTIERDLERNNDKLQRATSEATRAKLQKIIQKQEAFRALLARAVAKEKKTSLSGTTAPSQIPASAIETPPPPPASKRYFRNTGVGASEKAPAVHEQKPGVQNEAAGVSSTKQTASPEDEQNQNYWVGSIAHVFDGVSSKGGSDKDGDWERLSLFLARVRPLLKDAWSIGLTSSIDSPQARHAKNFKSQIRDTTKTFLTVRWETLPSDQFGWGNVDFRLGMANGGVSNLTRDLKRFIHRSFSGIGMRTSPFTTKNPYMILGVKASYWENMWRHTLDKESGINLRLSAGAEGDIGTDRIALGGRVRLSLSNTADKLVVPSGPVLLPSGKWMLYGGVVADAVPYDLITSHQGTEPLQVNAVGGAGIGLGKANVLVEFGRPLSAQTEGTKRNPTWTGNLLLKLEF